MYNSLNSIASLYGAISKVNPVLFLFSCNLRLFVMLCISIEAIQAQTIGDLRTNSTASFIGNWNSPTSWERYNGTTWDASGSGSNNPGQIPTSTSAVWIQTAANIILTQNGSCCDLHICTNTLSGVSSTALGKINLQTYTLNVSGKIRCYYASLGTVPGSNCTSGFSVYPFLGTTGKISIVGNSRSLTNTGEWSATIYLPATGFFPLEINLNSNQTISMGPNIKCSSLNVISGTLDLGSGTMSIDNGTDAQGDITIYEGAIISCSTSGSSTNIFQRTSSKRCGTLTINSGGSLTILGGTPRMDVNAFALNGTVNYSKSSGTQNFIQTNNDTLSAELKVYSSITISGGGNKMVNIPITANGTIFLSGGTFVTGGYLTLNSSASVVYNNGTITGFDFPTSLNNYTPNSGTTTLSSNLTLTGTLNLGNNTLDIGAHTLTINGDYTTGTGVIKSDGTGSIYIGGTGTLAHAVLVDQTIPGITNRFKNFSINRGTSPSSGNISLGNSIEVSGKLTLFNGILNTDGYLTLVSNALGTARVDSILSSAAISGNVKVQRYIPAVNRQYRLLSPNTASFTFSDLKDNIFVSGVGGALNGFDPTTSNGATIYTYHESTSGVGRGWKAATNITNSLSPAQGALVYIRGDRTLPSPAWYTQNTANYPLTGGFPAQNAVTIDYNGSINSGSISPTITYTNTGIPANDGWNLVGNPYPSQIDWNVLSKSNIDSWYYFLDPSTGSFIADNGANYIASGQAFFVQTIGSNPSIIFSENAKVASSPVSYFKNEDPEIEFTMVKDSFNADKAWICFNSSAAKGFVRSEDALKLSNLSINFGIYVDSNYTLQRSYVPYPNATDTFILSAYGASGNYKIQWSSVSVAVTSSKDVYLRDLYTSNLVNMRTNSSYSFSITSNSSTKGNRFQMIITDPSLLPVTWLSFTAEKINSTDIILCWETATEKNNSHYIVERSFDNNVFADIGLVYGNGNSTSNSAYSFIDKKVIDAQKKAFYYRIKQVDLNGNTEHSIVISVTNNEQPCSLIFFPNPAHSFITIHSCNALQGNISLEVFNFIGAKCISENFSVANGNEIPLFISGLVNGVYTLVVTEQLTNKKLVNKFIKN
jgi:Secretion system C-terminal sorting domain